ncbi:MAG: hypothetical protein ACK5Q5_04905 [Planctomycetaceae bacterium]
MAVVSRPRYDAAAEQRLRDFYNTLSEKDGRRFAAVEAEQFGYGGQVTIAEILGCSRRTIARGIEELQELENGDPCQARVRRPGAGRKKRSSSVSRST